MTKINFTNLPDTSTPLNATNMNALQTNVENAIGEIIEEGYNSSAKYTKYSDGTLIQYGKVTLQTYTGRSAGGLTYWSQSEEVTLPSNYADANFVVTTNVELANMNIFCQSYGIPNARDKVNIAFIATQDQESRIIDFICIGRWK